MFDRFEHIKQLHFKTFTRYEEVAEAWKSLLPPEHHLCCPDIYAPENAQPEDLEFRYVNIYRKTELIGLMYLQCLRFNSKHYSHDVFDKPILKPLKACIVKQKVDLLICGNLFRVNFQGFYFKYKEEKELIFDCLQKYRRDLKGEKELCALMVKDCSRAFGETQFSCYQFKSFRQDLTMELDLRAEWKTFSDYRAALSRKYRQRASKIINAAKDLELRDLNLEEIILHEQNLNQLYLQVVNKQSIALGILNAGYFREMKKRLGDHFKVFAYFKGKDMLAFSSHIYYAKKKKMEIHYIGLDYRYNQEYSLYFNILFDGIETAINGRYQTIEMGRTAREAKANVGAHPVENFNYIWIKPGVLRLAVHFLSSWFSKNIGEDWQKRHPFKAINETVETAQPVET